MTTLREEIKRHFYYCINKHIDKTTIPLYLFLSGGGTGKSRNAFELQKTAYRCFDANEEIAEWLRGPFVLHASFENGTSVQTDEVDAWTAIASRMLLQLLPGEGEKASVDNINAKWHPTTPTEVVNLLAKGESLAKRALFIVVDGLHNISDRFGEEQVLLHTHCLE